MNKQRGVTVVEGLLIAVVIGVVSFAGYYVWYRDKDDETATNKLSISSYEECVAAGYPVVEIFPEQCSVPGGDTFTRLAEEVQQEPSSKVSENDGYVQALKEASFSMSDLWLVADSGADSGPCGQDVTSEIDCLDRKRLVLADEGIISGDQFDVTVSTFRKPDDSTVREWIQCEMALACDVNLISNEDFVVQDYEGIKLVSNYGGDNGKEIRVAYYFASDDTVALVWSSAFSGQHYGFVNEKNIDYTQYLDDIEEIAKSIRIN